MNPGQSVKDRAGLFIIRDAEAAGPAEARRRHRRGHGRQYRHRPDAGRQGARLSHGDRHSRHAEPGEEGHAAAARRRADRGAGGALQEPEQLCEGVRPARRAACAQRAERRDLGQPVRQRRQPRRPYPHDRRGDLAPDRRQGRRLRVGGRHRRHAGRRRHRAQGAGTPTSRSRLPIRWARRCTATTPTGELKAEGTSITEGIGQGRITANLEGFTPDFSWQVPDEEALPIVFDLVAGGGPVPRRLDRHQHRRRDPPGARARARATPS